MVEELGGLGLMVWGRGSLGWRIGICVEAFIGSVFGRGDGSYEGSCPTVGRKSRKDHCRAIWLICTGSYVLFL